MQTEITDQGDLIMSWTKQERMELLGKLEIIKEQLEHNFLKIFGEEGPSSAAPSWKIEGVNQ